MSEFEFSPADFFGTDEFLLAAAEKQTNRTIDNKEAPLRTTRSQEPLKETLTLFSISDAAMNSALMKPAGAQMDIYNRVGQDIIAHGIADNGGVQTVMGPYAAVSPTDLILKAENLPTTTPNYGSSGVSPSMPVVGAVDPGGASISAQGWARPADGPVTSRFGPRKSPGGIGSKNHKGIDLDGDTGDPVRAAKGGTVTKAAVSGGFGNAVYIDHGEGISSVYAHLSQFNCKTGDTVMANQVVGLMGSTGQSTGPHLHFEIRINNTQVDPAPYLGV